MSVAKTARIESLDVLRGLVMAINTTLSRGLQNGLQIKKTPVIHGVFC
jgi:hypothetical protein